MNRKVRTQFRNEFPQLCENAPTPDTLSFAHIKDITEPVPVPVKPVMVGWVNLKYPETYLNVTFRPQLTTHQRMCKAVHVMHKRWSAFNAAHDIEEYYEEELDYDTDEVSEEDSVSAEDPEDYDSDFDTF
jgi:hypothetical protein